ncbi:MAG: flagellin lysine-N-methylase [Muribaculaceae bacterium]|nr:flagellin lysine-N-methylase [Roseburia sp.]MCM1430105.1 flagellin lysine-N-methylase [Muribaculaceae bacterium]MCM1492170.1 flagellin lysine-N-methylase [Muribaculaceae bacterium]
MILRVPDYYEEFTCIADRCKGSCCAGWEIDIDEPTRDYYCTVPGEIGERMREKLYRGEDGAYRFRLSEDGRCPFLNSGNLCDIITALGQEALSEVCTDFPRFSLSYGHVMQRVLSISCEEVGRILFSKREPVAFVEHRMACMADWEEEADEDYIAFLEGLQSCAIRLLQERTHTLPERVHGFLSLCEWGQSVINRRGGEEASGGGGAFPDPFADWSAEAGREKLCPEDRKWASEWCEGGDDGERYEAFDIRFGILEGLEELGMEWVQAKRQVREVLTADAYARLRREYMASDSFDASAYEQLLVYFVFRYFMQAYYSYDLLAYGRMAVGFTLMIRDLDICRWSVNGKKLGLDDRIDTAHVFSREVEHSEENFEQVQEEFLFL